MQRLKAIEAVGQRHPIEGAFGAGRSIAEMPQTEGRGRKRVEVGRHPRMSHYIPHLARPGENLGERAGTLPSISNHQPTGEKRGIVQAGVHLNRDRPLGMTQGHNELAAAPPARVYLPSIAPLPTIREELAIHLELKGVLAGAQGPRRGCPAV